jgi:hypothetical protein
MGEFDVEFGVGRVLPASPYGQGGVGREKEAICLFILHLALVVGFCLFSNHHWDKRFGTVCMLCMWSLLYSFFLLAFELSNFKLARSKILKSVPAFPSTTRSSISSCPFVTQLLLCNLFRVSCVRGVPQVDDPYLPGSVTCLAGDVCVSVKKIFLSSNHCPFEYLMYDQYYHAV